MTGAPRKALGIIAELALEAFITGLFMQVGESIVTETIRYVRKRGKKRKAANAKPDEG